MTEMTKIDKLISLVRTLVATGAYHRKRGFSLSDSTPTIASTHMLEEAVELQAEVLITGDREAIIEESSDLLATWLHLLLQCDVEFETVVDKCIQKLHSVFTCDINELETSTPGVMRRSRAE